MKYFVLGVQGMAGHMVALYLSEQKQEVVGYARQSSSICRTIVGDAFETDKIEKEIGNGGFDVVVNCIGVLNKSVDADLASGIFINSYFPHFLAKCCEKHKCKLIHISTDCVFSGKAAGYIESDIPDETSYYGRSKFLGEVTGGNHLSIRTSIVGPELKENGIGLFNWFMHQKGTIFGFAHAIWTGVTTLELAKAILAASEQDISGLLYLTNNVGISKYELLNLFNRYCLNKQVTIIRTEEPINSKMLVCTRTDFDYKIPEYDEMIKEMYRWIIEHKLIYGQYVS